MVIKKNIQQNYFYTIGKLRSGFRIVLAVF